MNNSPAPRPRWLLWLAVAAAVCVLAAAIVAVTVLSSDGSEPASDPLVLSGDGFALTNSRFAYYFWSEYVYLCSTESPPFDSGLSLAAQWYDQQTTWQDKLTELALETAGQTMVLRKAAEDAGFTLPEEYAQTLADQKDAYRQQARASGFDPADSRQMEEFLVSLYGPQANEADFFAYLDDTFLATAYSDQLYAQPRFTEAELSDYFDRNAQTYAQSSQIEKDDTRACTLRCIFLVGDDSQSRAEAIQAQFDADPTEEAFSKLADQYNQDESADEQGLYTNVAPNRAEEAIRSWVFDAARQPGDEALLQIESGHVLIYFVEKSDKPLWYAAAENDLRYETYRNAYRELESAAHIATFPDRVQLPVPDSLIPKEK